MKAIFMALAFAAIFGGVVKGQSGVYITQNDFENNILTYATNAPSEVNKIRFHDFFEKPYITVKHNGEKIMLFKDEIFAYKKKRNIVRTWNFTPYTFLEKGHVWIYYKEGYAKRPKGVLREKKYFFSTAGNSEILPLTVYNLKQSFPDNDLFHVLLDAHFRSDEALAHYDTYANKFKVNDLLEKTISGTLRDQGSSSPEVLSR